MQTPKTRPVSIGVPQRSSTATPQTNKQQKTAAADSDSVPSPARRTPKTRSPKIVDRRSPRSPASELKKQPGRITDLENQVSQLQEELKKANDQLRSSESSKKQALHDNEEAKKQLAVISAKLESSEQHIQELSSSEDSRVQELRKISQDRDRAWQSELEAVQKHHSIDSAALASAVNDIQKLKMQLERVAESEAAYARHVESSHAEVQRLRQELTETRSLVEDLENELTNCKESEARALEVVQETESQLEMAKSNEERLKSEGLKVTEAYNSMVVELEQSKNQIILLEDLVSKLQADTVDARSTDASDPLGYTTVGREINDSEKSIPVETELTNVKSEVDQLQSALETAERRYQEEYIQSTLQIRSAYDEVECTNSELRKHEAELKADLETAKADVEELKSKLMDKERNFHTIAEENQGLRLKVMESQLAGRESELELELKKIEEELLEVKASLLEKETKLQNIAEENEALKLEVEKRESEKDIVNVETLELAEAARDGERDAVMKLSYLNEEANESSRKTARVTEQLDAAQAAHSEMEAQLRRLKVQSDQWRKAAEAAAAMLTPGNNGKFERTGSFDNNYHTIGGKLSSPFSEDTDDESPKKKNGNMLKKIGVLLKKSQK